MSTLPDSGMKSAAEGVLALIGDSMTFYRAGVSNETTDVFMETRNSEYLKAVSGTKNWSDYRCFASVDADIINGDRVLISSVYWEVDNLYDYGTHLEFGLLETGEGA